MKRRDFFAITAVAYFSGRGARGQEKANEKRGEAPREPDLLIKKHSGCLAFSPDSKVLAVANGPVGDKSGICFLDPSTGKRYPDYERTTDITTRVGFKWPRVLAFSPDGKYFAAGGEGYIALWDASSGKRLEDLDLPSKKSRAAFGTVTMLTFTPDSKYIFAGRRFWPIHRPGHVNEVPGLDATDGIAFSRAGDRFATRREGIITLWAYPSLRKEKVFGEKDPSAGPLLFTPDGTTIVSEEVYIDRKPYFLWSIESGKARYIPFELTPGFYLDLSPDGEFLAAPTSRELAVMSIDTGRAIHILRSSRHSDEGGVSHDGILDVKFAPNQRTLVCSRPSGIRIWKDKNGFAR
jgi:WD40 repeat protein